MCVSTCVECTVLRKAACKSLSPKGNTRTLLSVPGIILDLILIRRLVGNSVACLWNAAGPVALMQGESGECA